VEVVSGLAPWERESRFSFYFRQSVSIANPNLPSAWKLLKGIELTSASSDVILLVRIFNRAAS